MHRAQCASSKPWLRWCDQAARSMTCRLQGRPEHAHAQPCCPPCQRSQDLVAGRFAPARADPTPIFPSRKARKVSWIRSASNPARWVCTISTIAARPFAGNSSGLPAPSEAIMPDHDLVGLWEAHTRTEFETRDVDGTMATMVDQPYVNHIPTMTGGVGHDQLKRFYKYHFIGANPPH